MSLSIHTLSERVVNAVQTGVIKVTNTPDGNYSIWKYDRNMVTDDDHVLGAFRSLVFSAKTGKLLCCAPGKSVTKEELFKDAEEDDLFCVTEALEGTMINLFWNPELEKWEIATRSGVGGNYWYSRNHYGEHSLENQKTFRQMFVHCMGGEYGSSNLEDIAGLNYLSHDYCYSFVIQHPENHLVYNYRIPKSYLVSVYRVDYDTRPGAKEGDYVAEWIKYHALYPSNKYGNTINYVYFDVSCLLRVDSIDVVKALSENRPAYYKASDLQKTEWLKAGTMQYTHSISPMGQMVVNMKTGQRYTIENPEYNKLKELRGNNPNLQYQYLSLNRINKVKDFLVHFPQYRTQFYKFYKQYHEFVTEIHNAYVNYYILKNKDPIPKKYFVHASKIHHNIYLPSLNNGSKTVITHRIVREYFDTLSPSSQIYYLNLEQ